MSSTPFLPKSVAVARMRMRPRKLIDDMENYEIQTESQYQKMIVNALDAKDNTQAISILDLNLDLSEEKKIKFFRFSLFYAIKVGNLQVISYLVNSKSVDINGVTGDKQTPLMAAIITNQPPTVQHILSLGAQVDGILKPGDNDTPLNQALLMGLDYSQLLATFKEIDPLAYTHLEILHLLIDYGASLNTPCNLGMLPLSLAVISKRYSLTSYLLRKNAMINGRDPRLGLTALIHAVFMGDLSFVNLLLQEGANIQLTDVMDNSPIIIAALKNNHSMAHYLLQNGANIHHISSVSKKTALIHAIEKNSAPLVELFIINGANMMHQHPQVYHGLLPITIAIMLGFSGVASILYRYMMLLQSL